MYPVCSFCGDRPVVAWFEGPSFRDAVDSADKVRAEEAWLTCQVCLTLVEANDREGLVERSAERQRRRDRMEGRTRTADEEAMLRRMQQDHLERLFWTTRSA
jgi:hypothetical protein